MASASSRASSSAGRISRADLKRYLEILEYYKRLVGLADYKVYLGKSYAPLEDCKAKVEFDVYEKEMSIKLSFDFKDMPQDRQKNILIHELVHARIGIFQAITSKLIEFEEEHLANDITRAIE